MDAYLDMFNGAGATLACLMLAANFLIVRGRKVGGITFTRIGRLQVSFCMVRARNPRRNDAR